MSGQEARQRANRIALWRSQILDAERDGQLTPLAALLDAFEADVRADAAATCATCGSHYDPRNDNHCPACHDAGNTNETVRHVGQALRIDPPGCRCTDCLLGESVPRDRYRKDDCGCDYYCHHKKAIRHDA